MRRNGSRLAALVLLLAGGMSLLAGCAKKTEQETSTTVDSTLSGSLSSDVPPQGPTPSQQYTPPANEPAPQQQAPPPKAATTTHHTHHAPAEALAHEPSAAEHEHGMITVPAGTSFGLSLVSDLSTKDATPGTSFSGTVAEDVVVDGHTVIPAGAEVSGHVLMAARSGKTSGRAHMQLSYDAVSFDGHSYNISAVSDTMTGKGGSGKDAAMIGGGAVAGGILGKVLGGSAVGGAVAGAAAGTAASLLTRGPDLHLEPGHKLNVTLQAPVSVTKPKAGA
jgi:hypothetical protein